MKECEKVMTLHQKLIISVIHNFPEKGKRINVSNKQGVYIVYSKKNEVLHVGTTKSAKNGLNQRLQNHLTGHIII